MFLSILFNLKYLKFLNLLLSSSVNDSEENTSFDALKIE